MFPYGREPGPLEAILNMKKNKYRIHILDEKMNITSTTDVPRWHHLVDKNLKHLMCRGQYCIFKKKFDICFTTGDFQFASYKTVNSTMLSVLAKQDNQVFVHEVDNVTDENKSRIIFGLIQLSRSLEKNMTIDNTG